MNGGLALQDQVLPVMPSPLRHMAVLILLLSLGFSTPGGLVVHLLFQLRQDYIAQDHCENRFTDP